MISPAIRGAFFALHLSPGASRQRVTAAYQRRRKEPLSPAARRMLDMVYQTARAWATKADNATQDIQPSNAIATEEILRNEVGA